MKKILMVGCVILSVGVNSGAVAASLDEVVALTLQSNPNVLEASNERFARDHELRFARGNYYPTLDLVAGVGRERSDNVATRAQGARTGAGDTVTLTPTQVELQATQLLFDGFARQSEVARQEARIESSAYTVFGTSQVVGLRTAEVYLEALLRRMLLDLSKENLAVHLSIFDQIEARSGSVGRKSDLEQIKGRLALARSNVIADEFNAVDADTNYLRVVDVMPAELTRPAPPTDRLPKSMENAVQAALAAHPTLKSAEADVQASIAEHKGARNGYYPRFDLEAFANVQEDVDGIEGDEDAVGVFLRMRYNLYRGGREGARIKATASLLERTREIRNNTRRQVHESIRLSWVSYTATSNQLTPLRERADASGKTRDAYKQEFNIGKRSLLDLLDTENEFIEAKRALLEAEYDNLFAQYRILTGTGQLLQALGIDLPESALMD